MCSIVSGQPLAAADPKRAWYLAIRWTATCRTLQLSILSATGAIPPLSLARTRTPSISACAWLARPTTLEYTGTLDTFGPVSWTLTRIRRHTSCFKASMALHSTNRRLGSEHVRDHARRYWGPCGEHTGYLRRGGQCDVHTFRLGDRRRYRLFRRLGGRLERLGGNGSKSFSADASDAKLCDDRGYRYAVFKDGFEVS